MDWSEKVKRMLADRNMNQKELSEKSGITRASISRYLKGNRRPRIDVVINFAKALGVEPEELLDEDEKVMVGLCNNEELPANILTCNDLLQIIQEVA